LFSLEPTNIETTCPLPIARSQRSVSVEYERDKEALAVFLSNDIGSRRDWAHGDLYEAAVIFLSEMVDRR
jgi:hypothetical protein